MDRLTDEQRATLMQIGWIPLVLLVAALLGVAIYAARRRRAKEDALAARELAVIVEEQTATGGGVFSMAMLVLTIGFALTIFVSAKSAIHEIEAGVVLTAGAIVWGLGIALGRKRSYRVFRSEHREPM